jgi:hypothetical protein
MTHKALLRQLQISCLGLDPVDPLRLLVDDVIAALAQQEQEPVAYWKEHAQGLQRDYDSLLADFQAQRTWVGLTDDEISEVLGSDIHDEPSGELRFIRVIQTIEVKLKEKNT